MVACCYSVSNTQVVGKDRPTMMSPTREGDRVDGFPGLKRSTSFRASRKGRRNTDGPNVALMVQSKSNHFTSQ